MVSAAFSKNKKRRQILGREMAYLEVVETEVTVEGIHFVQEDSPDEIGTAIAHWMKSLA